MTLQVSRGTTPATARGRLVAEAELNLLVDELPRIRTTALAWRNGLAALLAGLVGFGLIKGRSDVSQLAFPWHLVVGGLLALSLLAGGVAAAKLLRAAHGPPRAVDAGERIDNAARDPAGSADRAEALVAARHLYGGVVLSYTCAALLVLAVGTTWYGPARSEPRILVVTGSGTRCGVVEQIKGGVLTLRTAEGRAEIDLAQASGIRAVDRCPASPGP